MGHPDTELGIVRSTYEAGFPRNRGEERVFHAAQMGPPRFASPAGRTPDAQEDPTSANEE